MTDELLLCRQLYPNYKALFAALEGRSHHSIRAQCRRLGLTGPVTKHSWTGDEVERLRELFPTSSWEELLEAFPFANKKMLQSAATARGIQRRRYQYKS